MGPTKGEQLNSLVRSTAFPQYTLVKSVSAVFTLRFGFEPFIPNFPPLATRSCISIGLQIVFHNVVNIRHVSLAKPASRRSHARISAVPKFTSLPLGSICGKAVDYFFKI